MDVHSRVLDIGAGSGIATLELLKLCGHVTAITFPKIVEVEKEKRERFFTEIKKVIDQYGHISVPVLSRAC